MESILVSGMAVAVLVALADIVSPWHWLGAALSPLLNAGALYLLTGALGIVQVLAAVCVTAVIGLITAFITPVKTTTVDRRLR